jgi:hypothetical protein
MLKAFFATDSKRFGKAPWSGRWLAGPSSSIKYAFMFLAPTLSSANPSARPKLEFKGSTLNPLPAQKSELYFT